jgi:sialic acid synthase SpsE
MNSIKLGNVHVGDGHPVVFVAEIGTFFNKDIDLAKQWLRKIKQAGADVFKTEILHNPDVCLKDSGLTHKFNHATGSKTEDYRALIERKVVPLKDYIRLFSLCDKMDMPFIATVYDFEGVDFLVNVGASGIKIARDNINNIPLIRYASKTGLPIIFDAGIVYMDEVIDAVTFVQKEGNDNIIVNHHPGFNPAKPEVHNMSIIKKYKEEIGCAVGLSCHYRGDEMLYLAIGMGANLLEKGVVDDPDRVEQDLVSACSIDELKVIVDKVKNCSLAVGDGGCNIVEPRDLSVRKGLIARKDIKIGEVFNEVNMGFAFPPLGVSVVFWDDVIGCKALKAVKQGEAINAVDIDFNKECDEE